jgi:hypothetical protein
LGESIFKTAHSIEVLLKNSEILDEDYQTLCRMALSTGALYKNLQKLKAAGK